ncbi:MAG: hypothetical protein R3252_13150, partial [Robiginitalea sp.]|nr:hypothetical protein [Robiginitalea sp.]
MKRILFIVLAGLTLSGQAQTEAPLLNHYEAYYKQMRSQGDVRGVINALTHLYVLQPSLELAMPYSISDRAPGLSP